MCGCNKNKQTAVNRQTQRIVQQANYKSQIPFSPEMPTTLQYIGTADVKNGIAIVIPSTLRVYNGNLVSFVVTQQNKDKIVLDKRVADWLLEYRSDKFSVLQNNLEKTTAETFAEVVADTVAEEITVSSTLENKRKRRAKV